MPSSDPKADGHSTVKKKRHSSSFVVTSPADREQIQEQWAQAFYKNRWSFHTAEDPEFRKAMEMMRPGIGERLLTERTWLGHFWTRSTTRLMGR
jgi:hypothetical protein